MRFDPQIKKTNSTPLSYFFKKALVALIMVGFIAIAPDAFAQNSPLSYTKGAPKTGLNWSDMQKPRKMSFTTLRKRLRPADAYATLAALQLALSRLGDGQTYAWHRPKRQLRAFITPINSFRNKSGSICRELIVSLALGSYLRRIETTACRAKDHSWQMQS